MFKKLDIMPGTIRVKVPELLKARQENEEDLRWGIRVAPQTAERLAQGIGDRITYDVLAKLCDYFGVGVDGILEYVPDENGTGS